MIVVIAVKAAIPISGCVWIELADRQVTFCSTELIPLFQF